MSGSFSSIRALPPTFDPSRAARTLAALAEGEAPFLPSDKTRPLLEFAFGNSPHLARLALREPVFLAALVSGDPAECLKRIEVDALAAAGAPGISEAMSVLRRAKRQAAASLGSGAMRADSRQSEFCMYLSGIVLGGLLLNALFGWWWADPLAGLIMVPIIAREGIDALRGKACGCGTGCH